MRAIGVGIVGAGFVGAAHIEALRRLGFARVVALAQRDLASAQHRARALGVQRAYGDWRELIADPEVELVHDCAPNDLHFAINRAAIEAGKPVLSEKPLAVDSRETGLLVELAAARGVPCAVNFNYRFFPMVEEMRQRAAGELGRVFAVHGHYLQDWLLYKTDYNWRVEPRTGGRSRALADIGSHWCDLAQHILGRRIERVLGDAATVHPKRLRPTRLGPTFVTGGGQGDEVEVATEDLASVLLRFEDGIPGSVVVSQVSAGRKNRLFLEIDGERGSLSWDQESPGRLLIGHRDRANEILSRDPALLAPQAQALAHYPGGHEEGWPDALKNVMARFYRDVLEGAQATRPDYATFEDGHRAVRIIECVLESVQRGTWVHVTV